MEPKDIIAEIDKLELSEKLILVEDIWDSIAKANSKLPMPEWQKLELDKRAIESKNGTSALSDWKTVHEKLRSEINEA
jgi:putative addiction module component (TIGR02574 family)